MAKADEIKKAVQGLGLLVIIFIFVIGSCGGKKGDYTIASEYADLSYSNVKRVAVAITIPETNKKKAKRNIEAAVKAISKEVSPDALVVKVFFEGETVSTGTYTVADAIWAPNGKWADADQAAPKKTTITFVESRF